MRSMTVQSRQAFWLFAPVVPTPPSRPVRRNTSIGGLSFALEVDGQHVAMRISDEVLRKVFGARRCRSTWLQAYRDNATRINARAVAAYHRAPQSPVFLDLGDFAALDD